MIALRTGYKTETTRGLSPLAGFTAGVGLNVWGQEFAYAWLPYGDLGDTQYFSLLMRFGQGTEARKNLIQYQTIKTHVTAIPLDEGSHEPDYDQLMQMLSERDAAVAKKASGKLKGE